MSGFQQIIRDGLLAAVAFDSPRLVPLVIALLAAMGIGVVALYVPQARAMRRRWRWVMAGLRLAGLSALGVSILQPVIQRPPRAEELGAVVVVVDRSRGMGVTDRQRTSAQLVALADGLNRLPPGVRFRTDDFAAALRQASEQLDLLTAVVAEINFARMRGLSAGDAMARLSEVVRAFEAAASALAGRGLALRPKAAPLDTLALLQKSLDALRSLPPQTPPDRAWIDAARSTLDRLGPAIEALQINEDYRLYASNKQVRATCEELHSLNRLHLVETALLSPETGLLASLPPRVPVFGFAAGTTIEPMPLKAAGRPVRRLALEAGGLSLDSGAAVRAALDQLHGVPVQAVVLFSGGHETTGTLAIASGVPVFTIAAAPQPPGRDLSVSIPALPQYASPGEPVTVQVRVRGMNVRAIPVEVRFEAGAPRTPPPIASGPYCAMVYAAESGVAASVIDVVARRVTLGDDGTANLSFTTTFDRTGAQPVRVRVIDLAGEITTENNATERYVKVIAEKTPVAILAGSPGWDFRYLRDLLGDDPRFSVISEVLGEGVMSSLSPQEILSKQLIVLYDVPCAALRADQWAALHRMVAERGGVVVLIAGPDHLPNERGRSGSVTNEVGLGGADYLLPGPASDLLPFVLDRGLDGRKEVIANWRLWQGQDPVYQVAPTPALANAEWLRLADAPGESARRWGSLSPIFSYLVMPPLKPAAHPLWVERASGAPIATEHAIGAGHVVFIGTPETWRWRLKIGGRDHERLWGQVLRHFIEPPYAVTAHDENGHYQLDLPPAVRIGQPATVQARFSREDGTPLAPATARIRVAPSASEVEVVTLTPTTSGRFTGTIGPLSRGEYSVQLLSPADGRAVAAYPLHVAAYDELEPQDVIGDRAALARLAEGSGGEALPLEQVNALPARLEAHRLKQLTPTTLPLWDSGYLFLFVLGCLAAEWSLRKRAGLA